VEILWWLAPSVVATIAAMFYVSWVGAKEPAGRDRSEAARAKMGEALSKPIPQASVSRIQRPASNGVVVQSTRRSA
jgi:hypothetical protein